MAEHPIDAGMISRLTGAAILMVLLTGCAARARSGAPLAFPVPPPRIVEFPGVPVPDPGHAVVVRALALQGAPYRNGGADPGGFDCSGFVQFVFAQNGWRVSRSVADLYSLGVPIALDRVTAGDLVFFTTVARGPSHVGIAIGSGEFVHAPSSRGRVRVERLAAAYWARRFVGARRLIE